MYAVLEAGDAQDTGGVHAAVPTRVRRFAHFEDATADLWRLVLLFEFPEDGVRVAPADEGFHGTE